MPCSCGRIQPVGIPLARRVSHCLATSSSWPPPFAPFTWSAYAVAPQIPRTALFIHWDPISLVGPEVPSEGRAEWTALPHTWNAAPRFLRIGQTPAGHDVGLWLAQLFPANQKPGDLS